MQPSPPRSAIDVIDTAARPYSIGRLRRTGLFEKTADLRYEGGSIGVVSSYWGDNVRDLADALNRTYVVGQGDSFPREKIYSGEEVINMKPYRMRSTREGDVIMYETTEVPSFLRDTAREVELLNAAWREGFLRVQAIRRQEADKAVPAAAAAPAPAPVVEI